MEKHGQHFQTLLEQKIIIKVKLCLKQKSEANTKVLDMQLWYKAAKKKKEKMKLSTSWFNLKVYTHLPTHLYV